MAYATRNGSTQQVADAVAVALRERGAQVTPRRAWLPVWHRAG
jgi:menaquinone-dependent protoporphyrinogen IX oxidase